MAANMEKINGCFRALGTFFKNVLTLQFPIWLFIVAFLVCVLLFSLIACNAKNNHHIKSLSVGTAVYNNHTYLLFENPNYLDGTFVIVHDPDCVALDHIVESQTDY